MMKKLTLLFAAILMLTSYSLTAQVAINTDGSSADASAMLDVKSTSKGFLPPRMTQSQRDGITPVEGLIIYNTTTHQPNFYNGTEWMNYNGTSAKTLAIGDSYQGGIIAYILQPGDPGYDASVQHGLIAATADQSAGIQWYNNGSNTTTGAVGTALGTGNANTTAIVTNQGAGSYAAQVCADYSVTVGGVTYSDWYLPSKDELYKLYLNQTAVGGFVSVAYSYYWSSSEYDNMFAWGRNFANGAQAGYYKFHTYYVRAIRSF